MVASVEERQDHVEITQVRGVFTDEDEEPQFTMPALDYLLRSHALNTVYPAPLPFGAETDRLAHQTGCQTNPPKA